MIFHEDLEEIVLGRHKFFASPNNLVVFSGYVGPSPIRRLEELPFQSKVIYGMYASDGIAPHLHSSLQNIQKTIPGVDIYYSLIPVHTKCYVWSQNKTILGALVGSANFSNNGLRTPYREILSEVSHDSFKSLRTYIDHVLRNSQSCLLAPAERLTTHLDRPPQYQENVCVMTLLDPRTGETQNANGLNWGQGEGNHTTPDDANIPIRADYVRNHPDLFPEKQPYHLMLSGGGRPQRHNDPIEIIWDDGTEMQGLLEGVGLEDGEKKWPKQIASFPEKATLGRYFRKRLGLPKGVPVQRRDLENYGRTNISVSLMEAGVYLFDFSIDN